MNTSIVSAVSAPSEQPPLVSVWLITYNHEPYIAQAIESVLMQETSFTVELVIGEDFSSDHTREIVQAYKDKYPDRIQLFLSPRNLGMVPVLKPTFAMCRGKYVAMLDGDDYWTDPQKLQKQIDLMEAQPECKFSFHNISIHNEIKKEITPNYDLLYNHAKLYIDDFINHHHPVVTLSVTFRNVFGRHLPRDFYNLEYPDFAIYIFLLHNGGYAQYISDNMGVYRIHSAGSFSSLSVYRKIELRIMFFEKLRNSINIKFDKKITDIQLYHYYELFVYSVKHGYIRNTVLYLNKMRKGKYLLTCMKMILANLSRAFLTKKAGD